VVPVIDEQAIAARLKELRESRSMSQVTLAAQLGINQSLLSRYERGELRLHGALLAKIAAALRVSADQLLGLSPILNSGARRSNPQVVRRLDLIERLSKRDRQVLLKNVDTFLKGAGVA
jgi:transcriptional regulator with XRE-family HTH domain